MNTTPPFFYFPGGFTQFSSAFVVNGDLGINFNQPGDYFYDSLNDQYIKNPTLNQIIALYFPNRYDNSITFTYEQCLVAYYYPVLKEAFLDPEEIAVLNVSVPGYTNFGDIYEAVVYNYQGLNDPLVLQLIQQNLAELDNYRTHRTFINSLINKYTWSVQTTNNRVSVNSQTLNTSITTDITRQQTNYLTSFLSQIGLSLSGYISTNTGTINENTYLTSYYTYCMRQLATYFGINYGSYTVDTLANISTIMNIQDGRDLSGVFNEFSLAFSQALSSGQISINPNYDIKLSTQPTLFPNILSSTPTYDYDAINNNSTSRNRPYDFTLKNIIDDIEFINASGEIYINEKLRSGTTVAYISSGQYTIFRFRSKYRQTLQVETLPSPFYYRYPYYNPIFGGQIPYYFNKDYTFNDLSLSDIPAVSTLITSISGITYGIDISAAQTTPLFSTALTVLEPFKYIQFQTPLPSTLTVGATYYKYPLNIQIDMQNDIVGTTLTAALYGDRAAFMADAGQNTISPYRVLQQATFSTPQLILNVPISAIADQNYYLIVKANQTAFGDISMNFYTWWDTSFSLTNIYNDLSGDMSQGLEYPYQNPISALANLGTDTNLGFTKTNDTAWQKLPAGAELFPPNPNDAQFNIIYPSNAPQMCYDLCGISTDLTDYKGWQLGSLMNKPTEQYRIDPITGYKFQTLSGYSQTKELYIYPGINNTILSPVTNNPYSPNIGPTQKREYKIVNWYDTHFIPPQSGDTSYDLSGLPTLTKINAFDTSAALIGGYTYMNISGFTSPTLQLGEGVYGFSFLPSDGWWDVERVQFKSAYCKPGGPNDNIKYIGIFDTHAITHKSIETIDLSNAYTVLSTSRIIYYSTTTQVAINGGFDPTLGAYYEFTSIPHNTYLNNEGYSGYTPYPSTIINKEQAFYSAIAFDSNRRPTPIFMLTGSLIPYPDVCSYTICGSYLGIIPPSVDGVQYDVIVPTLSGVAALPSYVKSIYQSQYEQSIPIGTQILHYKDKLDVIDDINALQEYELYLNATGNPDFRLRTSSYKYGTVQYLLAGPVPGDASGYFGDIYQIRYPGTESREVCYIQQLDFRQIVPSNHQIVTWTSDTSAAHILCISGSSSIRALYSINNLIASLSGAIPNSILTFNILTISGIQFGESYTTMYSITNAIGERCAVMKGISGSIPYLVLMIRRAGTNYFTTRSFPGGLSGDTLISFTANPSNPNSYSIYYSTVSGEYFIDLVKYDVSGATGPDAYGQYFGIPIIDKTMQIVSPMASSINNIYMGICGGLLPLYTWSSISPTKVLRVSASISGYSQLEASQFTIPGAYDAVLGLGMSLQFDAYGGLWVQEQFGTLFDEDPWKIYGNAQTGSESSYTIKNAWQIFYPTIKIGLTRRANAYNNTNNLTEINYYNKYGLYYDSSNPNFPLYNHTQMFLYPSYSALLSDLSGPAGWKWGQENSANYTRADISFSGYYFNSYIFNAMLEPSPTLTGDEDYYYLAIRGYMPSEDFQTMIRFTLPQRYDYGFMNFPQLINEISGADISANAPIYNPSYSQQISTFNSTFVLPNFRPGGTLNPTNLPDISFNGFAQFYSTFVATYKSYAQNKSTLTGITDAVRQNTVQYISTFYADIIPTSQLTRANLTSPLRFDLLFKSSIASQLENKEQGWGLGWNLGFPKQDLSTFVSPLETNYCRVLNGVRERETLGGGGTSYTANSFYKILEDYIYLRLNEEYSLNGIDSSSPENLQRTLDTQGQTNLYYAKLLLANFGNYAQTMIQNPIILNPPISKLSKMKFSWIDANGNVISNNDCDWSGILQITETIETATAASTLPTTTVTN